MKIRKCSLLLSPPYSLIRSRHRHLWSRRELYLSRLQLGGFRFHRFCRQRRRRLFDRLPILGPPIQEAQIRLPPNRDHTRKQRPVLHRDEREAECRHGRPELARVDKAHGDRDPDALHDILPALAREKGLHAEEVRVEDRGEAELVDHHLGAQREDARRVIKVVGQPQRPAGANQNTSVFKILLGSHYRI